MMFARRPRRLLGLALGEKQIHLAELQSARGGPKLLHSGCFTLPDETAWERPAELGRLLATFLQKEGFAARQAVAGLPGRWLLIKPRSLPVVGAAETAQILRLAVEREYHGDGREWAFDYCPQPAQGDKAMPLLALAPRQRLEQVTAMLQAAGLRPRRIGASGLTLARHVGKGEAQTSALLLLASDGAELTLRAGHSVLAAERLAVPPVHTLAADGQTGGRFWPELLAAEMQRILALAHCSAAALGQIDVCIAGPGDHAEQLVLQACSLAGLTARINPDLAELGLGSHGAREEKGGIAVAAALAISGFSPAAELDFLHSRLAQAKQRRFTRPAALALTAGVLAIGAVAWMGIDWFIQKSAVDELRSQLAAMKSDVDAAQKNIARTDMVRLWYDRRPPVLDCLRALTTAFPTSGAVWTTSLTIHEDLSGTLSGKAEGERAAIELLDSLRSSGQFRNVKLLYLRQAERNSRQVSFALSFIHQGQE